MSTLSEANAEAVRRLCAADPVVVDVGLAIDVMPGYAKNLILTSGAPLPWPSYVGGQREAIIGGALFEGLASTREEAIAALDSGAITVAGCHDYGAVGSLAGIYTASMPVFVVRDATHGNTAFCNFYEGKDPRRLNYGCYDEGVHERLLHVNTVYAPVVGEAIRRTGGVALKPLIARGLRMGDECHSRNAASTLLFSRELFGSALDMAGPGSDGVRETFLHIAENDYFFLRLSMAAAKATADSIAGLAGSSVVSAMGFSCREFAIRVSGLGDEWFRGPTPVTEGRLFPGHDESEITWMGGESPITETIGLGGFAQACALSLQEYQGGSPGGHDPAQRGDVPDHGGREHGVQDPAVRLQGHPDRGRHLQGAGHRRAPGHGCRPGRPRRGADRCRGHPGAAGVLRTGCSSLDGGSSSELTARPLPEVS